MDVKNMQALIFELQALANKATIYSQNNEYVYKNVFESWIKDYNDLLQKYNSLANLQMNHMSYNVYDLSSTHKTVKKSAVEYFSTTIENLIRKIEGDVEKECLKTKDKSIPAYQMRKCFKVGVDGCPINPSYQSNRVFIAMPFANEYLDSYNYGMVPVLNGLGYEYYKADNEISNKDIMCKVCNEIQSCRMVIANISGLNPNVMLELGLAYGLGKPVIIIKDRDTKAVSDIGSIEYIEYSHAGELQQKLFKALSS